MEAIQNLAELEPRHQIWVDFCAMGGLVIDSEGKMAKMTADGLAKQLKVSRRTLYDWQGSIPHFWEYVKQRRNELYARDAMTLIYKAMLKKAANGDVQAAKLMMQQARVLEAEKIDLKQEVHTVDNALD